MSYVIIPQLQVRSNIAIMFNRIESDKKRSSFDRLANLGSEQKNTYSGTMTNHARKRLAKTISLLNQCTSWRDVYNPITQRTQRHKLSFLTLTIPQVEPVTGKEAYKNLLKPFLRIMQERYKNLLYVWKAELQERGQIHYHLTINELIPHTTCAMVWNKLLAEKGYMYEYIAQYGHNRAPSIEIRSVKNVQDIEAYLVKYVSKEDPQGRKIDGKIWGASRQLTSGKYFTTICSTANEAAISALEKAGKLIVIVKEMFTILRFLSTPPLFVLSRDQQEDYRMHLQRIREPVPA